MVHQHFKINVLKLTATTNPKKEIVNRKTGSGHLENETFDLFLRCHDLIVIYGNYCR